MDSSGFGSSSGPLLRPKARPLFGNSPPNPFSSSSSVNQSRSHNPNPNTSPINSGGIVPFHAVQKQSWQQQSPPPRPERPAMPSSWNNQPKQQVNISYVTSPQRVSPVAGRSITHDSESNISTKPVGLHAAKRTRSPPLPSHEDDILGLYNPLTANARRLANPPSLSSQMKEPVIIPSTNNIMTTSPANGNTLDVMANFRSNPSNPHVVKRTKSPPLPSHDDDFLETYNHNTMSSRRIDDSSRRTRVPYVASSHFVQNLAFSGQTTQMENVSVPRVGSRKTSPVHSSASPSQMSQIIMSSPEKLSPLCHAYTSSPKRGRSPPVQSTDLSFTSSSVHLDHEREMQAKAKRFARFNVELTQPLQTPNELTKQKFLENKNDQASLNKKKNADGSVEEACDTTGVLSDYEGMRSSKVVVGQCPDMCPESEREERERKGDLDKFERLDGDRNQTTKFLAVKKYTRTAEREADLIRPLPVLQKTVAYLLNLLDQPYNENFLGIYNFLWDRMRAVRMDLRMQHIFNHEAILMLEQMIRLHIVAMHELCEYKKGEGFTEGFDAHLNIEQMNKTSVELFQMYEDHRKRGESVSTEKEFRGYYALLKLDKHPGYKVEPSELSLDLAKMTPEMRCTPEILFARAVARACRVGNFVAFFRLARRATYLQACLMHAHFAKVRTQALASLHSGLQSNQGIPVSHVVKWLGMEEEDIESLLEYHGFQLRRYGELYMVKEGPFLNSDKDFPTTRSRLVQLKKSEGIVDDVKSVPAEVTEDGIIRSIIERADLRAKPYKKEGWVSGVDEELNLNHGMRVVSQTQQLIEGPLPTISNREDDQFMTDISFTVSDGESDHEVIEASPMEENLPSEDDFVSDLEQCVDKEKMVGFAVQDAYANKSASTILERSVVQAELPASPNFDLTVANTVPHRDTEENLVTEASMLVTHREDESFKEKLKLILRKWKERSSLLREIREQREFLANVALSSLTLGPPVRRQSGTACATEELNIDHVARERFRKLGKSWARLNVAELVAPVLSTRNPDAKCISWKLVFLAQASGTESQTDNLALNWLHTKIMGSDMGMDEGLLVSSPGLSIWRKWTVDQSSLSEVCCLSILREMRLGDNQPVCEGDHIAGPSCLLYLSSVSISWDIQRVQLHKLLTCIPSGASLPLLILCTDPYKQRSADPSVEVTNRLGLHEADKTKISSLSVIFLHGSNGCFDDDRLKEGIQWLANHSPIQPILRLVNPRELALGYMRHSVAVIENLKADEIGPDHCISAFNEALDLTAEEITAAASTNTTHWPSPEINLLNEWSDERVAAEMYLPSVGWSSADKIEPIIRGIKSCKLPRFPYDVSWLNQGSPSADDLQKQKLAIEESLVKYLTDTTRLLSPNLAVKEATVMLQKGAGLELRGSCHYIVPRWVLIFQRIFNWQLTRLRGKEASEAYILARKHETSNSNAADAVSPTTTNDLENGVGSGEFQELHPYRPNISLDELMEISCNVPFAQEPRSVFMPSSRITPEAGAHPEANDAGREDGRDDPLSCGKYAHDDHPAVDVNEQWLSLVSSESLEKLDMLVGKCTRLQDKIDDQLYVYF